MDFRETTVEELVGAVCSRRVSSRDLTQAAIDNIESLNPRLNAFCAVNFEDALAQADAIDARLRDGDPVGPLAGIPIGVKDLEDARGFVTTYGAELHAGDAPALHDSVLVALLREAGCVILGKTNTPEFGFKGVTDNRPFGATRNPWNPDYSPGGSSGGTAAALASGMIPLGTGSDGGGSIRIPASVCGFSGIKASQGRVPAGGTSPPGSGVLSVKGPMALRVRDVAYALDAVLEHEPTDIFSLPRPAESWRAALNRHNRPRRVVWSPTMGFATVDAEIMQHCEAAITALRGAGVDVVVRETIWEEDPRGPWYQFWSASRARVQGDLRGTPQWEQIDEGLRPQIEHGMDHVSGVDYARALDACHYLNAGLVDAFHAGDFILTPTTCGQTPRAGSASGTINGTQTDGWVAFTYGINMTRNPAGTVCVGKTGLGLPIGLQIIGNQRDDVGVLKTMCFLEDLLAQPHNAPAGVA